MAVENGTYSYMPSQLLAKFETDISPLMGFMGWADDYLCYEGPCPETLLNFWQDKNVSLPQLTDAASCAKLKVDELIPWGWSPVVHRRFAHTCPSSKLPSIVEDAQSLKKFFSRETSLRLAHEFNTYASHPYVKIPHLPQQLESFDALKKMLAHHPNGIVVKTNWSSSGRGLLFIRSKQQLQQAFGWLIANLKKHGSLITEPLYQKVQDASLQFIIRKEGKYDFLGINYFDADNKGRFSKEYIHIPSYNTTGSPKNDQWLRDCSDIVMQSMHNIGFHKVYHGPIGIDAMFIITPEGKPAFYPIVEANLRCNMGLINLHIKKLIDPDAKGSWQITPFNEGAAPLFYSEQVKKHPCEFKQGKISKGFLPLTAFDAQSRFAAWGIIY